MKIIAVMFAMFSCFPIYAQQSCANYPYDEGIDIQDVQGGIRILATGQVSVGMDDIDSIKDAREEATIEAKAIIAKFLTEEIRSDLQIDKLINESKQADGKSVQVNRIELTTRVKSLRNSAQALLRGVVPLGSCYTKAREVRVTVGLKPETIRAAEGVAGEIGRSVSNQPSPQAGQASRQGSQAPSGGSTTTPQQGLRGMDGHSDTDRIKKF